MDTHSRLSSIYRSMKNRCYNSKSVNYKWYGEKGITVCEEWLNEEKNISSGNLYKQYIKGVFSL